jgi:hypothetical protein
MLQLPREALELALEPRVLEGRHPPALLTDGVVVVLATWNHRLVSGDSLAELDALHQSEPVEEIQRPVDARDADVAARLVKLTRDLVCRQAAVLAAEERDDGPSGAAGPVAALPQRRSRSLLPVRWVPVSHGPQASS